jgi:hypothetical protein
MGYVKKAKAAIVPQQLSLTFETEVIRRLAPRERQMVTTAVAGLLIVASGLKEEHDDER